MQEFIKDNIIDNRYLVLKLLGGGGFGKVFSVYDQLTNEKVALKYCLSEDEEDIKRFNREVRIMETINHENVIQVLDSNLEHCPPYFTMPQALYSVLEIIPSIKGDIKKVLPIFESICNGIIAIHNSGHTHRDIKPDNVLVFEDSKIIISDLGLAKFDERDTTVLTRASIYMGTYAYMPPEQMTYGGTRDLDHKGDVFQLGKTLYHLLTGHNPTILNPEAVPIAAWYVIQKATRQTKDDRYHSVDQLLDALHDAVRSTDPEMNSKARFNELYTKIKEELKKDQYNLQDITKIFQIIYGTEDEDEYIDLFHEIPLMIIEVYSSNMTTEFEPIIEKYKKIIDKKVGGYPFSFAESISLRMEVVFKNTSSLDLKKNAILCILMAAHRLNRWTAMGYFDKLLQSIEDDHVAYAVADGLKEEIFDYKGLYQRVSKKELHPAIQIVWEQCEKDI